MSQTSPAGPLVRSDVPALSQPFELAGKRLKNRIVHASMSTMMARDSMVTDMQIRYYETRAKGGAGMIVTEPHGLADEHFQRTAHKTRAFNDDNLDGLKRWAEAVESHDCRILAQLHHPGRARHHSGRHPHSVAPSALPCDLSWTMGRVLSVDEIRRFVDGVGKSAARLKRCGWSGLELSCGHGHLIHQFMSPWSNIRTDEYGGDWDRRLRFVRELVASVRSQCGLDFIIGLKLPGDDGIPGSIGPDEAALVAALLARDREFDYVCFAMGSHARSLEMHLPDRFGPRLPFRELTARLRAAIPGVPLIALGRITDPAEAEAIVAGGEAEFVGLGRPLVADPAWMIKAERGRTHDIRYCVSCNTCWDTIITDHKPIACVNNPRIGQADEADFWPAPAQAKRRVVVVGAGIAGLEAAWVAAARGHEVTVFGRSSEVGGKARLRTLLPGGETVSSIYDYQMAAALRAGARFELGVEADLDSVLSLRPDAVVLACGSTMVRPHWLAASLAEDGVVPDLREAMAILLPLRSRQRGTAVIYDMDHTEGTYASAEHLSALFDRVVLVTPRNSIADLTSLVLRQGIERRFAERFIETVMLSEIRLGEGFEAGRIECVNVYNGRVTLVDDVVFLAYSTPRAVDNSLAEPLRRAGVAVHLVGDCLSPREYLAATAEGHAAGNAV